MDLSLRYFLLLILRCALIPLSVLFGPASVSASPLTYWTSTTTASVRYSGALEACKASHNMPYSQLAGVSPYVDMQCYGSYQENSSSRVLVGRVQKTTIECEYGAAGLYCSTTPPPSGCASYEFETVTGICLPKPNCPADSTFSAQMNGGEGGCACKNGTNMVKLDGFSMCMQPLTNDVCTADSPDFAGYINGYAACPGSNRCPSGTKPGFVGSGGTTQPVCYPVTGSQDPSCNGSIGMVGGESVCIPVFGNDPDCPLGSGVINGEKTCITDPNNDPTCPGGVVGYVGSGSEMNKTCIDPSYAPKTCPPGQYIVTKDGSGFGCVTASTKPPADPAAPPKEPQVISGTIKPSTGTGGTDGGTGGTGTAPCPEGQECNGQDIQIKLPAEGLETTIDGLFEDAPNNNYKDELDEFGQSELDSVLNADMHFADVRGQDGLFTERSRLEQFTSFVKTHTVGNSTNCSGNLPFLGMTISCEKFANYNRILGYMLSVFAMMSIYKTLMRPSASGV